MKAITSAEARKWCSQKTVGLRVGRFDSLRYKQSQEYMFFITAPEEHRMITAFAYHILNGRGEHPFSGGLLWLQRWDIGSPGMVRPGWLIVENIRWTHGELRSLEVAPAQFFRDDELVELHAFLNQTIAFGWVTDYIPCAGHFFIHFKDNRQVCFTAESAVTLEELRAEFQRWKPTDKNPIVERIISIEKSRKQARQRPKSVDAR
jgi:hypothetical protein